jgi:hypothetical protein
MINFIQFSNHKKILSKLLIDTKFHDQNLSPNKIFSRLGHVPDPRHRVIPTLFSDLQIPDVNPTHSKVRNLKRNFTGQFLIIVSHWADNRRQLHLTFHSDLTLPLETRQLPNDCILIRVIAYTATRSLKSRVERVGRDRDMNLDIIGRGFALEQSFANHSNLKFGRSYQFGLHVKVHQWFHLFPLEKKTHSHPNSVRHQLEFAIGRDERD